MPGMVFSVVIGRERGDLLSVLTADRATLRIRRGEKRKRMSTARTLRPGRTPLIAADNEGGR